ncbi:MAG: hypothetical protein ACLFUJ_13980, partial [Phycisphaerae bacterium]
GWSLMQVNRIGLPNAMTKDTIVDATTGKILRSARQGKPEHLVQLAGPKMVLVGKNRSRSRQFPVPMEVTICDAQTLSSPSEAALIYEDLGQAKQIQRLSEFSSTKPSYLTRTGPFFQGRRMFLRSHDYLYCIGEK